jgi:hypothetical protein
LRQYGLTSFQDATNGNLPAGNYYDEMAPAHLGPMSGVGAQINPYVQDINALGGGSTYYQDPGIYRQPVRASIGILKRLTISSHNTIYTSQSGYTGKTLALNKDLYTTSSFQTNFAKISLPRLVKPGDLYQVRYDSREACY